MYDPLHNWTLSPSKAYALQQASEVAGGTCTPLPQTLACDSPIISTNSTKPGYTYYLRIDFKYSVGKVTKIPMNF